MTHNLGGAEHAEGLLSLYTLMFSSANQLVWQICYTQPTPPTLIIVHPGTDAVTQLIKKNLFILEQLMLSSCMGGVLLVNPFGAPSWLGFKQGV